MGIGKVLRLYDLGKKKLLRKCESFSFPLCICSIKSMGNRIFVADIAESYHFCYYRKSDNSIDIFADDFISRFQSFFFTLRVVPFSDLLSSLGTHPASLVFFLDRWITAGGSVGLRHGCWG